MFVIIKSFKNTPREIMMTSLLVCFFVKRNKKNSSSNFQIETKVLDWKEG